MSEQVSLSKASAEYRSNYLVVSLKSEFSIGEAIALLRTKRTLTADENESRNITVQIAYLQSDRARIEAERIAFLVEQTVIIPPSEDDVNAIIALSSVMDEMTADATTSQAVLNTASQIMETWSRTLA